MTVRRGVQEITKAAGKTLQEAIKPLETTLPRSMATREAKKTVFLNQPRRLKFDDMRVPHEELHWGGFGACAAKPLVDREG